MSNAYRPTAAVGMATSSVMHGLAGGTPVAQGTDTIDIGKEFDQHRDVMHSHADNVHAMPTHDFGPKGQLATGTAHMPHIIHEPRFSKPAGITNVAHF